MGHPRCNEHKCQNDLVSVWDRFCAKHADKNNICAMPDCLEPARPRFRTCSNPQHSEYEEARRLKGQSYLRLKRRINTTSPAAAIRAFTSDGQEIDVLDDPDFVAEVDTILMPKPSQQNPPEKSVYVKSKLTRRWTFCEQLLVHTCGIIIGRACFFEAESVSNVLVSANTFASLPYTY